MNKHTTHTTGLALSLVLLTAPMALAGQTEWQDVAPETRIRVISSDRMTGNETLIGVEIDMPERVKTYWRIPGETGIPMMLDFAGSTGLDGDPHVIWPFPLREAEGGYVDFVYRGKTVVPIKLTTTSKAPVVKVALMLGVCDDICVPVRAEFSIALDREKPDGGQVLRLDQAVNAAPIAWDDPDLPIGAVTLSANGVGLDVAIDQRRINPDFLIVDNGDPRVLFAMPQKSPTGDLIYFEMLGNGGSGRLQDSDVRLTFLTKNGAFELTRKVTGN